MAKPEKTIWCARLEAVSKKKRKREGAYINAAVAAKSQKQAMKMFENALLRVGYRLIEIDEWQHTPTVDLMFPQGEFAVVMKRAFNTSEVEFGAFYTWDSEKDLAITYLKS